LSVQAPSPGYIRMRLSAAAAICDHRWLGGMLTNWRTTPPAVLELDRLERMRERGDFARLTKKKH